MVAVVKVGRGASRLENNGFLLYPTLTR